MPRGRRRVSRSGSNTSRKGVRATRARSSRRATQRVKIDPEKLLDSMVDDAVQKLGLTILGLNKESYKEMLKPIVEGIVGQYSSRPSKDAIISRLRSAINSVYMIASAYLLEKLNVLTQEQLEFVVNYGGPVAARNVTRLYRDALKLGRKDLLPLLRSLWEQYGTPTPVSCPRCGFRAVTPELECMVCGYTLSEREAKEAIDFEFRLAELVEFYSPNEVIEAIERGFVVVGSTIKPPSAPREPTDIVLHLTRSERELLRRMLEERKAGYARDKIAR